MKWGFKIFRLKQPPAVLQATGPIFGRVEHFVRSLTLVVQRLVKLVIERPMSDFRAKAAKLAYTINDIKYGRSPFDIYNQIMVSLRALNAAGTGVVRFERPLDKPVKFGVDAAQLSLWRDFTKVLLAVLASQKAALNEARLKRKEALLVDKEEG
jgi:hypothetical protein